MHSQLGNENVLVGSLVQNLLWMEEPALRLWVPRVLPHSPELPVQVSGAPFQLLPSRIPGVASLFGTGAHLQRK